MKKFIPFVLMFGFIFAAFLTGCQQESNAKTDPNPQDNPDENAVPANDYFWGTWVRMDNGTEYEVLETSVVQGKNSYNIISSNENTLAVIELGTFKKESDSVMVCNNIPYFRKGGANLEYSLKLVGFTTGRAAGTAMSGIKGKGKSTKYSNFESLSESDAEGYLKFTAPTANDTQTVEIENGNELVVLSGLNISNSGDYMGTVALVGKNDYNLKITGTISDDQKDNGYLFGNNAKTYNMQLTITNISENKCSTSACFVKSDNANLVIEATDGTDLSGFTISTLAGGATKTVNLSVVYGDLDLPYIDTGISVTIQNPLRKQEWSDYIPLRFFKGTIPITIAAKNPENNNNAALNGFVIYPDGNNQFFAIPNNNAKPIFVPTFGSNKPYTLVFSGATVTSQLDDSTEMYYTVEPASLKLRPVVTSGSDILNYIPFGDDNHSEDKAYSVTQGFEAYLSEGEIDYYSITADSDIFYGPDGSVFYSVSYVNEKGDVPDTIVSLEGTVLSAIQLPEMTCEGYKFLGWYSGTTKIVDGSYKVNDNITLEAKWQKECTVSYVTAHGTAPTSIIVGERENLTSSNLPALTESGWIFLGWYTNSSYDEDKKISVGQSITTSITLYAKWEEFTGPELTTAVTILPSGTNGTAGTSSTYVLFGDWPQTIKASDVTVYESISEVHGGFTYYSGSDGYWYVKCQENARLSSYTYSDGTSVKQWSASSTKYFKVEPIKWRVLTTDYNSTGKALLLAENILTSHVPYYVSSNTSRTINSKTVYVNNYKYSTIRAYLNGKYESEDSQSSTYTNKGFLQSAFTTDAQNLIATTTVDNSTASTTDSGNNLSKATIYCCENTSDKIFLLSVKEVTSSSYGFASYDSSGVGNARIRMSTDYALANYAYQSTTSGYGGWWFLRSPSFYYGDEYSHLVLDILNKGCTDNSSVTNREGIVPALSISLPQY